MNKKIFIMFSLILILFLLNSVNAVDENIHTVNSTENSLYSVNSLNDDVQMDNSLKNSFYQHNDNDSSLNSKSFSDNSEEFGVTYNQVSQIEVSDGYDDGEYWVDDSSNSLKIKIKVGKTFSTDGKIIVEYDGETHEYTCITNVGHDTISGRTIYGFSFGLDYSIVQTKSFKDVKITFVGNRYNVTNKTTGETLEVPKVKDSTINIKVRTGTKTIIMDNIYNTKFELNSDNYKCIKKMKFIWEMVLAFIISM